MNDRAAGKRASRTNWRSRQTNMIPGSGDGFLGKTRYSTFHTPGIHRKLPPSPQLAPDLPNGRDFLAHANYDHIVLLPIPTEAKEETEANIGDHKAENGVHEDMCKNTEGKQGGANGKLPAIVVPDTTPGKEPHVVYRENAKHVLHAATHDRVGEATTTLSPLPREKP